MNKQHLSRCKPPELSPLRTRQAVPSSTTKADVNRHMCSDQQNSSRHLENGAVRLVEACQVPSLQIGYQIKRCVPQQ